MTQNLSTKRKGGKAAYVSADMLSYGFCRMLDAFHNLTKAPFGVKFLGSAEEGKTWLVAESSMTTKIKTDNDQKIIKRVVSGVLHTDRAIRLVRELSIAAKLQKDYDILLDFRESATAPEMTDLMAIMSAWSRLADHFDNKIAVIFSKDEEHTRFVQLFKACMEAQGFKFRQLFDYDTAIEWLTG